jgi:GntR family transcriptional regulator/MocR family aminotransferase
LTLLTWARQHRAWIIEDDYDSEFRYTGSPLPALQGLDQFNCVLYMGTFSKVLHPALRLGYLVVPNHLIDAFSTMKAIADRQAPLAEQAVLASFIEDGHFGRHIRRMRMVYAERQQILLEAAQDRLEGLLDVQPAEAGFHLVGWLPPGLKDTSVSDAIQQAGIECPPLSRYTLRHRSRSGLMLGYAGYNKNELLSATAALATQMRSLNSRIVETEV